MKMVLAWPVLCYLRFFARRCLQIHKPIIIGIAGSVGKSSTKNALQALLKDHFPIKVIAGNSETGIPLGLLGMEVHSLGFSSLVNSLFDWFILLVKVPFSLNYLKGTKYIIVEMGIDEPDPPKNMEYLLSVVKPDIAISLNIAPPHLGQFEKTIEGKNVEDKLSYILDRMAEEDTKIITQSNCKIGIYNQDDKRVQENIHKYLNKKSKTKLVSFGLDKTNDVAYNSYRISEDQTFFSFLLKNEEEITLQFQNLLLPQAYQEVFAASILVGLDVGLSHKQICHSLEKNFTLPKGRSSIFQGINHSTIIDSSYNASPKAVLTFLQMLHKLKEETKRPAVFLFGDMRELGSQEKEEHERIAKEVARVVDYLYCVGPLTRQYVIQEVEEYNKDLKEIRWFDSAKRAGEFLKENLPEKSIILVKGSQNTIFLEEAIKYILEDKKDIKRLCRQEKYWLEQKDQSAEC